jgi:hypothetical protein
VGSACVRSFVSIFAREGFRQTETIVNLVAPVSSLRDKAATSSRVTSDRDAEVDTLIALDKRLTGLERGPIWRTAAMHKAKGNFGYVIRDGTTVSAWLLVRKATNGYRIGPLYAPDPTVAEELLRHALKGITEDEGPSSDAMVYISIFKSHPHASDLFRSFGFTVMVELGVRFCLQPACV